MDLILESKNTLFVDRTLKYLVQKFVNIQFSPKSGRVIREKFSLYKPMNNSIENVKSIAM
jgi:hypothetical protein